MITQILFIFLFLIISFFIGAIPTGFIIGKIKGIDIRKEGSGNIGATNTLRVLGPIYGILVLFIDVFKSFMTLFIIDFLSKEKILLFNNNEYLIFIFAIFILLGNVFNPFLKFKGGKGVATTVGIFLFLNPIIIGLSFLFFILIVILTRYVSLGSIFSSLFALVLSLFITNNIYFQIFTFFVFLIILIRHKENIKRLIKGNENKIKFKK